MSFEHAVWHARPYSNGVLIGSDWADKPADDPVFGLYKKCGFWSKAETFLLEDVVAQRRGEWLEIGAHTGHCSSSIANHLGGRVTSIEPMFSLYEWYERFSENTALWLADGRIMPWAGRSDQYFEVIKGDPSIRFDGALIDGDHDAPHPLRDAQNVFDRLNDRSVVLMHDFRGPAVWDAAKYLVDRGMQWQVYPSVHMVFVAWLGEFTPPEMPREGPIDWAAHYGLPGWAK